MRWLHPREFGDGDRFIFTLCWRGSLRFLGARLFLGFRSAWRLDAAHVANAVELSADASRAAVCRFVPDLAGANDSHGFDTAGDH